MFPIVEITVLYTVVIVVEVVVDLVAVRKLEVGFVIRVVVEVATFKHEQAVEICAEAYDFSHAGTLIARFSFFAPLYGAYPVNVLVITAVEVVMTACTVVKDVVGTRRRLIVDVLVVEIVLVEIF